MAELNLVGTNTGSHNVFASLIGNPSAGNTTNVLIEGATWALTGLNNYTGTTFIESGGTLLATVLDNGGRQQQYWGIRKYTLRAYS